MEAALVDLCRAWGEVRFRQPDAVRSPRDWNRAFLAAEPLAAGAESQQQSRAAVAAMLSQLRDPLTHLGPPVPTRVASRFTASRAEGLLILTADDRGPLSEAQAAATISRGRTVLLDLRAGSPGAASSLWAALPARPLPGVVRRWPHHRGFAPEQGWPSGVFSRELESEEVGAARPQPGSVPERKLAVVVSAHVGLLPLVAALRSSGEAAVFGEVTGEGLFDTRSAELPSGIALQVRTSELVGQSLGTDPDRGDPLAAARAWLSNPRLQTTRAADALEADDPRSPALGSLKPADRTLAVCRLWTAIHLFHPGTTLDDPGWGRVLGPSLVRAHQAPDDRVYQLLLARMAAAIADAHVAASNLPVLSSDRGDAVPGMVVSLAGGRAFVRSVTDQALSDRVLVGDEVTAVDGLSVAARMAALRPLLPAPNLGFLDAQLSMFLLAGPKGSTAHLTIQSSPGRSSAVDALRSPKGFLAYFGGVGDKVRTLGPGLVYLDLIRLRPAEVAEALTQFRDVRGFVVDLRGAAFSGAAAAFSKALIPLRPARNRMRVRAIVRGQDTWEEIPIASRPSDDRARIRAQLVALIDARTASSGEAEAWQLRSAEGAQLVGEPTAGANGNMTSTCLPGGLCVDWTGTLATDSDGRSSLRVGISPDLVVAATAEALRAGRDLPLERAAEQLRATVSRRASLNEPSAAVTGERYPGSFSRCRPKNSNTRSQ